MAGFITPLDIANRALQHCGVPRILTFTDTTRQATETNFAIDKVRRAELRRSVWGFAVRRAVLRPLTFGVSNILYFATWSVATTYGAGDIVVDSNGAIWISIRVSNLANTPGAGGNNPYWNSYAGPSIANGWDNTTAYFAGDPVGLSGSIYICIQSHTGHTPPNTSYWHAVGGVTPLSYVQIAPLGVQFPTGGTVRNIYPLPYNYIRIAPQDAKAAGVSHYGVTAGMPYNDWEIEANYIFTADSSPIVLRFVADQNDVTLMDDLFCEVWAARLALEVCETLTQSSAKAADIKAEYTNYLTMAKACSSIESGSTEPEIPEGPIGGQPPQQGR